MGFESFVGIDWSGAAGTGHSNIQIARCEVGSSCPKIVQNPRGSVWSRCDLLDWITAEVAQSKVLIGCDFAFGFPFKGKEGFFPGETDTPKSAPELWQFVDEVCRSSSDLYAGEFVRMWPWHKYFRWPGWAGQLYEPRHRLTDRRCKEQGLGTPSSVFNLIGPTQVGLGSLAGMRFLRNLSFFIPEISIWPFCDLGPSTVIEVYPQLFFQRVGFGRKKVRDCAVLTQILQKYGSTGYSAVSVLDDNVSDAIIIAAALRSLFAWEALWLPETVENDLLRQEGWIFGVT